MNRKRKMAFGMFVVGILMATTIANTVAEKQKIYARNPSIQNSKYYVLEFSIESNAEKAFLILDGEKHEMFEESGRYICRTSFNDGNHEYYFELDDKRIPEKGSYKITEVERRWILLSSLIGKFNWKLDEEIELKTQADFENLTELQKSRVETCAMIRGIIKRILVSGMLNPENFDTKTVFNKIDTENLEKLAELYGIKFKEKGKTLESLYEFFKDAGERYITVCGESYTQKEDSISSDKNIQKIETAKKNEDWILLIEEAEKLIKNGQDVEKALTYKNLGLARLYGDKDINTLKKEEKEGYSVRTLYEWTNECHPYTTKYYQGYTFLTSVHAYWGKLLGVAAMDFDITAIANCSLICMDIEVEMCVIWGCNILPTPPWNATANNNNYIQLHRVSYGVPPWTTWPTTRYDTKMWANSTFNDHGNNFDGVVTVPLVFYVGIR
jgi:hypothetical protein